MKKFATFTLFTFALFGLALPVLAADNQNPESVVTEFCKASSIQDAAQLTTNAKQSEQQMKASNERFPSRRVRVLPFDQPKNDQPFQVTVRRNSKRETLWVVKTSSGYRIDYQASRGTNPQSLKEFQQAEKTSPQTFRATVQRSATYQGSFVPARSTHTSLQLTTTDGQSILAYIPKTSEAAKTIAKLLEKDTTRQITVEIQRVGPDQKPLDKGSQTTLMTRLVSETFVIPSSEKKSSEQPEK